MTKMTKMKSIINIILVCLSFVILLSCTVSQNITINHDTSGSASLKLVMDKSYVEMASEDGGDLLDTVKIKKQIESRPGVSVSKIALTGKNILDIKIAFTKVEKMFSNQDSVSKTGIFYWKKSGNKRILRFHLNKQNFNKLLEVMPEDLSEFIEFIGFQEEDDITEEEYLEMMEAQLGVDANVISNSSVTININAGKNMKILSCKGAQKYTMNSAVFKVRIMDILLLSKPLDFSITFN